MYENHTNDEITLLIDSARSGNTSAENRLCELVFRELYRIAKGMIPANDISLQPTMLVNDLWVKLFNKGGLKKTENRKYFFTVAASQMRFILIDYYRKRNRKKAGGDRGVLPKT